LIIIGLYVLPSVTARFAGSHTMEYSATNGYMDLKCSQCHQYILQEMQATNSSIDVYIAHLNATDNANYANAGAGYELNFPVRPPLFGGVKRNVCQLCHAAEADATTVSGSHTKLVIRVCTDEDCHGNSTTRGAELPEYAAAGYVGLNLSTSSDPHSGWFKGLEARQSPRYKNEDGGYYSQGFYACLGCHTHLGMTLNITRPNSYTLNMTVNTSGVTLDGIEINESSTNTTISITSSGSKWR